MKTKLSIAALLGACALTASASVITVTSLPLFTDTGINLTGGTTSIQVIGGQWGWAGAGTLNGGAGTGFDGDSWDYFYQGAGASHGQLIAAVGGNYYPVNTGTTLSGLSGHLYLGINDDAASGGYGDNVGSLEVNVSVPDSGSTLALFTGSMTVAALAGRRLRK